MRKLIGKTWVELHFIVSCGVLTIPSLKGWESSLIGMHKGGRCSLKDTPAGLCLGKFPKYTITGSYLVFESVYSRTLSLYAGPCSQCNGLVSKKWHPGQKPNSCLCDRCASKFSIAETPVLYTLRKPDLWSACSAEDWTANLQNLCSELQANLPNHSPGK